MATATAVRTRTATRHRRPNRWWLYVVLTILLLLVITPFIWMVLGGFKTDAELNQVPPTWWPQEPTISNFTQLFAQLDFGRYFANSAIVAVVVTVGNLLFCSMIGYALAQLDFKGKRIIFALVLITLMIPGVVTFIPLFILVVNLGLADTIPGLFLPFLVAPFGVFLMRQFFLGLPRDLLEAGRIDGAGELRIFFGIFLPLAGPALATLSILTFLGSWNNFLWPLVIASSQDTYTLPVALALYSTGQHETQYGLLLAGATVVIVPIMIVFAFFQRYFTEGIATTGIK